MLADSQVKGTVQLDEIFDALDPRTRAAFQGWQQEAAKAIRATARISTTRWGTLPAFADDGTDLLRVLDGQEQQTRSARSATPASCSAR